MTTNLDNSKRIQESDDQFSDALTRLLNECAIDTGVSDFAQQHDNYLYGLTRNDVDNTR